MESLAPGQLGRADGPLVWIDCEMTGLDPRSDRLLEIAVLITNGNLEVVDEGVDLVIQTEKNVLDHMNEWCIKQHGQSGLTQACLSSPHSHDQVEKTVLDYIKSRIPHKGTACLAGNSVHADKMFLDAYMPSITDWLHYRIVDVSTIKELHWRWFPQKPYQKKVSAHRALDDIRGSISELKWYRENVFRDPESV
ncbi:unnamed protein product [Peniophora sp. CBMAI 1063]|nr:unnamed protein product [Peniophora sp. CBMAI 1063]